MRVDLYMGSTHTQVNMVKNISQWYLKFTRYGKKWWCKLGPFPFIFADSSIDAPPSFKPAKKYADLSGLPVSDLDPCFGRSGSFVSSQWYFHP